MKKLFLTTIILFSIFINFTVIYAENLKEIVKIRIEGLNSPVQILENKFISENSIFILEHKPGAIIEVQNFDDENSEPKINTILNLILNNSS